MSSSKNRSSGISFSLRLAMIYTSVLCVSLAAVLSVTYQLVRHIALSRDQDVISAQTEQYKTLFDQGGVDAISWHFTRQFGSSPEQMFVRVVDDQQKVHFITVSHPLWNLLDGKTNLWSRISSGAAQWDELFRDGQTGSWIIGSIALKPGLYLQVGRSNSETRRVLSHFRSTAVKIIIPVFLLSLIAGWVTTRSAVMPLRSLVETLRNILSTGDMKQRVPIRSRKGELDGLTILFNQLLDQNETLIRVSGETLDNVAHDLRTPMTHLKNATEQALLDPDAGPEILREALADCAEESDKILQIFNLLMDMAEADTGQMRLTPEPVDLRALAGEVCELYELIAEEREIRIVNRIPQGMTGTVDRARFRQCLSNLMDNALKYSPKNTEIELAGCNTESGLQISIRDQGIGIPTEELSHIWDRLYRGEHSRSTSGLGLGLSFVKAIVVAHSGRIDVQSVMNEGTVFTIFLPRPGKL